MNEPKRLEWTENLIKTFWHYHALYRRHTYLTGQVGDVIASVVKRWLPKNSIILDFGGGPEGLSFFLPKYNVEQYDLGDGTLPPGRFNAVTLIDVIEHLSDEKVADVFRKINEKLVSDGILIITTENEEDMSVREVFCPACEHVFHRNQHVSSYSAATMMELLKSHGYEILSAYTTTWWVKKNWKPWVKLRWWMGRHKDENLVCIARKTAKAQ